MRASWTRVRVHASTSGRGPARGDGRAATIAAGLLLTWSFLTGGQAFAGDFPAIVGELAALPLIAWAVLRWPQVSLRDRSTAGLLAVLLVMGCIALLQLPLPLAAWTSVPARAALQADLAAAGVTLGPLRWSLMPLASERALWSLLPGLAIFLLVTTLQRRAYRALLLLFVALAMASLGLGAAQMLVPDAAWLNPAPQWAPMWNGVFSNPNHQALALVLVAIVAASLGLGDRHAARLGTMPARWALLGSGVVAAMAIPLTGSRAALLLMAVGVVAAWALCHPSLGMRFRRPMRVVVALLLALGLAIALAVAIEPADTLRWQLIATTARMAWAHAPFGAGVGSFVPAFDAAAPPTLQHWEYFNHAQDEYIQWAFELGVLAPLCVAGAIAILVRCYPRNVSAGDYRRADGVAVAAWLACVTLLTDCLVEYPLRTPALLCVGALFAGVLVAECRDRDEETDNVGHA